MSQGIDGHKIDACIYFYVYESRQIMKKQPFFAEK